MLLKDLQMSDDMHLVIYLTMLYFMCVYVTICFVF